MTLSLDAPEWDSLATAYGTGKYVPEWLRKLESQDPDAIEELYLRLCHQRSVYSSSIAALPHLVRIAKSIENIEFRGDILGLVGAICESREFPDVLNASNEGPTILLVLAKALNLTEGLLPKVSDVNVAIYLLCSAAALSGFAGLARVIEGFVDEEFCVVCPGCGSELYVWPNVDQLMVAAEDPVTHRDTTRIAVMPGPIASVGDLTHYSWMIERAGRSPVLAEVSELIPSLFGTATCPKCRTSFALMDRLIETD